MAVAAKSAAYGLRAAVGVLPLDTGIPDHLDGAVTWESARVERALAAHHNGTDRTIDFDTTGSDQNANSRPIIVAPVNATGTRLLGTDDGDKFRMLDAEPLELRFNMQHPGADWTTSLIHDVLQSCSQSLIPASNTVTGTAYVEATGVLTVSDASDVVLGMVIAADIAGTIYYCIVTDIDSDDLTLHPRPPAHTAADADYRLCVTYGPQSGATAAAKLVHFDFVSEGLAHTALYCTGVKLRFELSDKGGLQLVASMRPRGGVVFRHSNSEATTASAAVLRTAAMNETQSCFHVSDVLDAVQVAPVAESYSDFDMSDWAFEVENSFDEATSCGGIIPKSDPSIVKSAVSLTGKSRNSTEFATWMRDGETRTVVMGFGPPKTGCGLIIPTGFLAETETFEADGEARLTNFNISNEQWSGADGAVAGSVATSSWLIAIPKSSS